MRKENPLMAGLSSPVAVILLLLVVLFSLTSPFFLSWQNFQNIFVQASTIGVVALGLSFVMLNGNIDLSVGSFLGLASAVFVLVYNQTSFWPAFLSTLALGMVVGLINGLIVWLLGVNSFITTLAAMIGLKGVLFVVTKESSITLNDFSFTDLSATNWLGLPLLGWIYLLLAVLLYLVQQHTVHGRNLYYVGGNRQAARDAGIAANLHQLANFALCSTFAALAGILLCSQLGASTPNTGRGYELWGIAAVAIGGVRLIGGVGSVGFVLLGGITIAVMRNGMNLLHISAAYIYIVVGLVLLVVLILDRYLHLWAQVRKKLRAKSLEEVQ